MLDKLEYVYTVYQEKSFTKAAHKLYISQPSLSAAIKTVETKLGAPLFDRSGVRITLTEVGKAYIEAAEKILAVKGEFENRLNDIHNLETGKLTVGGTNYLSCYVLPKVINRFAARYPKIEVRLTEANSLQLSELMEREEIDVMIDSFDEMPKAYLGDPLLQERIFLCVPCDRKINETLKPFQIRPADIFNDRIAPERIPPVPMEAFRDETFVMLKDRNDMYYRAIKIFEKAGIDPPISFSVDQLNISFSLAVSGMGLCFATDTLFRFGGFRDNVILYNIAPEVSHRTLYIARKKNKYCSRAMTKFIEEAKDVICPRSEELPQ